MCNLLRNLKQENSLDRVFCITPPASYQSNIPQFEGIPLEAEDVFDPDDPDAVQHVLDAIEEEREDYDRYWEAMKTYQELTKAMRDVKTEEDILLKLAPELLIKAFQQGVIEEPPEHK